MRSKIVSILITVLMSLIILSHFSVSVPIKAIQPTTTGNDKLPLEYGATQLKDTESKGVGWRAFSPPTAFRAKFPNFRPGDLIRAMKHRLTPTPTRDEPESFWYTKAMNVGTRVLSKFEQWKHKYPNTLGILCGAIRGMF